MMTMRKQMMLAALGFTMVVGATACGEDDAQPVDPQTTRQAISQNVDSIADTLRDSAEFLEDSELFAKGYEVGYDVSAEDVVSECQDGPDGIECEELPPEPAPEFDSADVDAPAAELIDFLTTKVFIDANVESSSEDEVTFLLRGQSVCADVEMEDFEECKSVVDEAQIRVKVRSPQAGDLNMDVLVGPSRAKPLSLNLWEDKLAAELDLAGVKAAAGHLASAAGGEAPELPPTMEGKIKGSLERLGPKKLRASFAVTQAVKVADGADTDIQIAQANPAAQAVIDGESKTLTVALDWKLIKIKAPMVTQIWDAPQVPNEDGDFGSEEPREIRRIIEIALGGLSGSSVLNGADDKLSLQNLGLGDTTTEVKIDGAKVFALDLNKDAGRRLSAELIEAAEGLKVELEPTLNLVAAFSFGQLANDEGVDFEPWMEDETLTIIADGAAKPALLLGDQLKVLAGKLTLKSAAKNQQIEVAANQCLIAQDQSNEPCLEGEVCDDPAPIGDEHPFDTVSAGVCE